MKHKVIYHKWKNGQLEVLEEIVESIEQAIMHAQENLAQTIKVYNPEGFLVHSSQVDKHNIYA